MKKIIKVIGIVFVLILVVGMVSGRQGSSTSSNKGADGPATGSIGNKVQSGNATSTTTTKTTTKAEASYEVGEGKVVVYKNSIDTVWAQISVPVKNSGDVNLYLDSGTMDIEDSSGHLVESRKYVSAYPQVIKPGETAWYYEETMLDDEPDSELKVIPHVSVEKAKVDCIRYEVSDVSISDGTFLGVKITGRVENTTDEDEFLPYVVVLLYDKKGEFLGQAFTIMDELKAGDKVGFSMTTFSSYDGFAKDHIGSYEVYSYPGQIQF